MYRTPVSGCFLSLCFASVVLALGFNTTEVGSVLQVQILLGFSVLAIALAFILGNYHIQRIASLLSGCKCKILGV